MFRVQPDRGRERRVPDTEHHLKRHAIGEARKSARCAESHVVHVPTGRVI